MAYADYEYYAGTFLAGGKAVVPEEEFSRWEKRAELEIDALTLGRVEKLKEIPDKVKDCACAVTELLYRANTLSEGQLADGIAGVMTSYSNDGQSGSFDVSQSIYTESGKKAETGRLVRLYLGSLGLAFAGVMHYEY